MSTPSNFTEFWPFYVGEHRRPITRGLHFVGNTGGLLIATWAIWSGHGWAALLGLVFGYALAWIGHFGFEKNRPATFTYPAWSFAADWKMWALIVTGRMGGEVKRLGYGQDR